ncbi:MAG: tetratricopeptide repeat protein [Deltaproteobacteria bacterium]|nr:tetratricopeptide repeat protein [Deltaproteobacteria bacterium]
MAAVRDTVEVCFFAAIVFAFALASYSRNLVWRDDLGLWGDAVRMSPLKSRGHMSLGIAYRDMGLFGLAIAELKTAVALGDTLKARRNLADAFRKAGMLDEAIAGFSALIEGGHDIAEFHNDIGLAYRRKGDRAAAKREFERAAELEPGRFEARMNLGVVYGEEGLFDRAIVEFRAALSIKDTPEARRNLATALRKAGMWDE